MTTPPPIHNPKHSKRYRPLLFVTAGIAISLILLLYALVDPAVTPMPRCPVKVLTGFDCPGCGSQRALHALLTGDFTDAWHYNPAMIVALPVIIYFIIAPPLGKRYTPLDKITYHRAVGPILITAIILWTLLRNVLY